MFSVNIVEYFYDRTTQVLLHPFTFCKLAGVQLRYPAVAKNWVIVARVDDGHVSGNAHEQVLGQVGNVFERDGHHENVAMTGSFLGCHRLRAGFFCHVL
jgi:hypothetical protein